MWLIFLIQLWLYKVVKRSQWAFPASAFVTLYLLSLCLKSTVFCLAALLTHHSMYSYCLFAHHSPVTPSISFCELYIKKTVEMDSLQTSSASKYASHKPLAPSLSYFEFSCLSLLHIAPFISVSLTTRDVGPIAVASLSSSSHFYSLLFGPQSRHFNSAPHTVLLPASVFPHLSLLPLHSSHL